MDNRAIGVFDSGVGGLTVVKEIMSLLPHEEICYFGDSKRAPYGDLSKETITLYARQVASFLIEKNVKAMVVACNTTSATCLEMLRNEFPVPIIGVIEPGVLATLEVAKQSVCLLATSATVNSGCHERLLTEKGKERGLVFYAKACTSFVPLIEEGLGDSEAADGAAKQALADFAECRLDTVILGCTHYPLMEKAILKAAGNHVAIVNPAYKTAAMLKVILEEKALLRKTDGILNHRMYVSGSIDKCNFILQQLFGDALKVQVTQHTWRVE